MADWVVAVCQCGREKAVHADLSDSGFVCYAPRYRERIRINGRKVWVERLLFGRYLFIEFARRWIDLLTWQHVAAILMANERPLLARESEIDRIKRSEVRGFVPIGRQPRFELNQPVLITGGPFAAHQATYEGVSNAGRDFVRLEILGQVARVELAAGTLIAT